MSYQPNKAIHPGITVGRTLASLGMTQKSLAERTGVTEKHISSIINGDSSITPETALLFANALGGTPSFWSNLQSNYEAVRVRLENEKLAAQEIGLITSHPYAELKKRGYVQDVRGAAQKVMELWRFYGVNSLNSVQLTEAVAWRRGTTEQVRAESLAAWLRCGELEAKEQAEKIEIQEYDETKLKALLPKIRTYTKCEKDFWNNLVQDLADVGVSLIAVEHFKGTRANGATRWIGGNPVIQLSAFGRNADGVWFSLMHEIGHILIHGRKEKFISFSNGAKSHDEAEADIFAARTLIPDDSYHQFLTKQDFSEGAIRSFAQQQDINPGIIVGRLKNDKWLSYGSYQHMHAKLGMHS